MLGDNGLKCSNAMIARLKLPSEAPNPVIPERRNRGQTPNAFIAEEKRPRPLIQGAEGFRKNHSGTSDLMTFSRSIALCATKAYVWSGLPQGPLWRTIDFHLECEFKMGFCQWPEMGSKVDKQLLFGCKSG